MASESPLEISQVRNTSGTVATVHCPEDLAFLESVAVQEHADLLEFRLDSLPRNPSRLSGALSGAPLPAIVTARHPLEGGEGGLSFGERRALLEGALPQAAAIDIELRSLTEGAADLAAAAKASGKLLILSAHDFVGTPSIGLLRDTIEAAANAGADIAKIATRITAPADLLTLLQLACDPAPLPLSIMGMGPLGRISRLLLAQCGSLLNYGYLAKENAPGQLSARRLKELHAELSA